MESEFVSWLRSRLPASEWLRLGPGDDAAILRLGTSAETVVTTDLLADSVHFDSERDNPRRIGRKALAVNLSDLAAMAAEPIAVVVSICVPHSVELPFVQSLYEGMLPLAEQFGVAVAGGDTNRWDGSLVISVTAIGQVTRDGPLQRNGAKVGDHLITTGEFGGSRQAHQFDFTPRIQEALALNANFNLHAGMDCSDGLALDVSRMATESGCGLVLQIDHVPRRANSTVEQALSDGEDFELLLALPPSEAARLLQEQPLDIPLTDVGEFIAEQGLWQQLDNLRQPLEATGFLHD